MDTMKNADQANWCLNHEQFADLASSLSTFFNQSGLVPSITPPTTTSKAPRFSSLLNCNSSQAEKCRKCFKVF